jgi:hypothetical protein
MVTARVRRRLDRPVKRDGGLRVIRGRGRSSAVARLRAGAASGSSASSARTSSAIWT